MELTMSNVVLGFDAIVQLLSKNRMMPTRQIVALKRNYEVLLPVVEQFNSTVKSLEFDSIDEAELTMSDLLSYTVTLPVARLKYWEAEHDFFVDSILNLYWMFEE